MIFDYDDSLKIEIGIGCMDGEEEHQIFIAFHEKAEKEHKIFRGNKTTIYFKPEEMDIIIRALQENLSTLQRYSVFKA